MPREGLLLVVAGVPGTGKTLLARHLSKQMGLKFTTLTWIVLEYSAWSSYDWESRSFIVEPGKLCQRILESYSRGYVFETHWPGVFSECEVEPDTIIVTRTHPLVLYERLARRGWPKSKIVENVEAELLNVIIQDIMEAQFKASILEVDTTNTSPRILATKISETLVAGVIPREFTCCRDWLELLSVEDEEALFRILSSHS